MSDTTEVNHMAHQSFNPNDVLSGKGRGFYNHPGNILLRNRVRDLFSVYEELDNSGKQTMVASLADEVLNAGGRFLQASDGSPLTHDLVLASVRNRFNQERRIRKEEAETVANTESPLPFPVSNDAAIAPTAVSAVSEDQGKDPGAARVASGLPPFQYAAGVGQDLNLLQDIDAPQGILDAAFEDEFSGEKAKLQQRLLMAFELVGIQVVDRSEEMAGALVNIVDLAASDGTIDELLYSKQMRACFHSLMLSHKTTKRARRKANECRQQNQADPKDGTKSVVTGSKTPTNLESTVESITSGFTSALNFKKDTYIDKLDIVSRRLVGEKGDKQYFGTTLNGLPHGLGAMIYTNKDKWLIGHWRKGKLHGLGCAIYENNHRCFGLFVKEHLHGKALYKTDESTYLGEYRKHLRHGRGKLVHDSKGTFDGHFHEDRFEGSGVYTAPNGHETVGDFVDWNFVVMPKDAVP